MTNSILHKADTRGHANHGWLDAHHSFSFANYYDPKRTHFGVLRVLNDDMVAPGMGFGMHPHDNMEIITIPLEGSLEHRDSMGNHGVIHRGEVQVMSAGTGITHSEFNASKTEPVKLLQIWVFPNKKNVTPRYDQIKYDLDDSKNKFLQLVSPDQNDSGSWIHQDAWFNIGKFDKDVETNYDVKRLGSGVYLFVISGNVSVNDQELNERDGFGIWNTDKLNIKSNIDDAEILLIEVPMN